MRFHSLAAAGLLTACLLATGCGGAPRSFNSAPPSWSNFTLREDLGYDHAWDMLFEVLVSTFDLEEIDKDDGYLRTAWLNTWSGAYLENYRVRVIAKFTPDRTGIRIRTEALFLSPGTGMWLFGTDDRLTATIKTDVMGTLGRTTR